MDNKIAYMLEVWLYLALHPKPQQQLSICLFAPQNKACLVLFVSVYSGLCFIDSLWSSWYTGTASISAPLWTAASVVGKTQLYG